MSSARPLMLVALATGFLCPLPSSLSGQTLSSFERDRAIGMLHVVQDDLRKHYFDTTYAGVDLKADFDTAEARVRRATRVEETLLAIAQATNVLHDGHTAFLPPGLALRADYGWSMTMVGDTCRVLGIEPGSDADLQGVRPGDAVLEVERIQPSRVNLHTLQYMFTLLLPRRMLNVVMVHPGGAARALALQARIVERRQVYDLTGGHDDIWELIRQDQNASDSLASQFREFGDSVLVWRLPVFSWDDRVVDQGLKLAKGRRDLILDLRGNPGGSEATLLRLLNGLSADSLSVATVRGRDKTRTLLVKGSGSHAFTGHVTVLVDSRSASAAEALSRVLQLTGRGRVLGDQTAGALREAVVYYHSIGTQAVTSYGTSVTIADFFLPDGKSIDGIGVTPDELLLPSGSQMAAGEDPVLARALSQAGISLSPAQAGRLMFEKP